METTNMPVLTLPNAESLALTVRAKALLFEDPASRELLARIHKIAPSEATTLVIGETGTGKEIVARHLHERSARAGRPFVAVNCGAFSETLVESELFGHERGAFTGAIATKKGWFESADGGTLFLDEIGDLSPAIQVKLLRVLQEREVVRVGAREAIPIDVRLVAATNVDLVDAVRVGKFREDLYYRLNVAVLAIPPLRARPGDILPLARYFLDLYGRRLGTADARLQDVAAARLLRHVWPGNIRELENVIHHALLVCRAGLVTPDDLRLAEPATRERPDLVAPSEPTPLRATTAGTPESPSAALEAALLRLFDEGGDGLHARIEETVMRAAFSYCDRNQLQTARLLGISRNVVRARLLEAGEIGGGGRGGTPAPVVLASPTHDVIRVGYQQFGLLWLLRVSGRLDRALASFGARVCWTEFPSGVELVEALSAGALDLGVVGEGPPLLAQALRAPLVYLAAEPPAPHGEAIVVRRDSTLKSVSDLRGKRIVLSRGTNVHYLLVRALEEAGVPADAVDVRFAPPALGRELFERGQADAWAVWDPWLASIEHGGDVRVLRDAAGLASNRAYYVAARGFSDVHAAIIDAFIAEVRGLGRMANDNPEAVIELLGAGLGLEKAALLTALRRNRFGVRLFDAELAAGQQHVADSSHRHHLIAQPVSIIEASWVQRSRGAVLSLG
jgi:aliphatic sulfonates family ABC transporter substrate-binding protein